MPLPIWPAPSTAIFSPILNVSLSSRSRAAARDDISFATHHEQPSCRQHRQRSRDTAFRAPAASGGPIRARINITVGGKLERESADGRVEDRDHHPVEREVRGPCGVKAVGRDADRGKKNTGKRYYSDRLRVRSRILEMQKPERDA